MLFAASDVNFLLEAEMQLDLRIVDRRLCHFLDTLDLFLVEVGDTNGARKLLVVDGLHALPRVCDANILVERLVVVLQSIQSTS